MCTYSTLTFCSSQANEVRDVGNELYKFALETVGNVLFGERLGALDASDAGEL